MQPLAAWLRIGPILFGSPSWGMSYDWGVGSHLFVTGLKPTSANNRQLATGINGFSLLAI